MERRGRVLTDFGRQKLAVARTRVGIPIREACQANGIVLDPKTLRASVRGQAVDVATWQKIFDAYGIELRESVDLRTRPSTSGNLPYLSAVFVGRSPEVDRIHFELGRTQIVTITASGGSGKTSLAKFAMSRWPATDATIWFSTLRQLAPPCKDEGPESLEQRVCEAVYSDLSDASGEVSTQSGPSLASLSSLLQRPGTVLILDNCEHHLVGVGRLLSRLMLRCPRLKILCTSRRRLGIEGECVIRLGPLSLPSLADSTDPIQSVRESEAGRLFEELATRDIPGFSLTAENARHIATICRRLGGIPRSLEIASRVASGWSLADLAASVNKLVAHDLRQFFEWSFGLLSDAEWRLLARLSVFVGGWTRESAIAVCSDPDRLGWVGTEELARLLVSAVDWDLVKYDIESDRYEMLEPDREFAAEQLQQTGEVQAMCERHFRHFQNLVCGSNESSRTPERLNSLESDHNNIREALRFALSHHLYVEAMELAAGLANFWSLRGHSAEGLRICEALLSNPCAPPTGEPWEKCLTGAGQLAFSRGNLPEARRFHETCLEARRARGDAAACSDTLLYLGRIYVPQGLVREGRACLIESYRIKRRLPNDPQLPGCLVHLGRAARHLGKLRKALRYHRAGLALVAGRGDALMEGWHSAYIGGLYRDLGDLALSEQAHRNAERIFAQHGDSVGLAWSTLDLGLLSRIRGDRRVARQQYMRALEMFEERQNGDGRAGSLRYLGLMDLEERLFEDGIGRLRASLLIYERSSSLPGICEVLESMILHAGGVGAHGRVACLSGIVDRIKTQTLQRTTFYGSEQVPGCLARARARLGEIEFSAAWRRGNTMSEAAAIRYAIEADT